MIDDKLSMCNKKAIGILIKYTCVTENANAAIRMHVYLCIS